MSERNIDVFATRLGDPTLGMNGIQSYYPNPLAHIRREPLRLHANSGP